MIIGKKTTTELNCAENQTKDFIQEIQEKINNKTKCTTFEKVQKMLDEQMNDLSKQYSTIDHNFNKTDTAVERTQHTFNNTISIYKKIQSISDDINKIKINQKGMIDLLISIKEYLKI